MVVADVEQWFAKSYTFHYNRNTLSNQCNEYDYDDSEYYYSVPPDIPQVFSSRPFKIKLTLGIKFNAVMISFFYH